MILFKSSKFFQSYKNQPKPFHKEPELGVPNNSQIEVVRIALPNILTEDDGSWTIQNRIQIEIGVPSSQKLNNLRGKSRCGVNTQEEQLVQILFDRQIAYLRTLLHPKAWIACVSLQVDLVGQTRLVRILEQFELSVLVKNKRLLRN